MKRVIAMTEQAAVNIARLLGVDYYELGGDYVIDVTSECTEDVVNLLCENECAFHDVMDVAEADYD